MQVVRGFPDRGGENVALTIGNFDGVHRGHQAMLARLIEAADDLSLTPAVLTFDPHPREFFAPAGAPARLSTVRGKLERFDAAGVKRVHIARFDAALAALPAEDFIARVLVERLKARWILVGDDFRFGRGRAGSLETLRKASVAGRYSVEAMQTVMAGEERVSSSAVRGALEAGDLDRAQRLLGRPYAIAGRVVHGDKLGRTLGFPTANIALPHKAALSGVFAVRVHGLGAAARRGAASLGVRPTITQAGKRLLEVFIFDFNETIYGRRIEVEFLHKLRDEARYADLAALTRQIRGDVAQAKRFFAARDLTGQHPAAIDSNPAGPIPADPAPSGSAPTKLTTEH